MSHKEFQCVSTDLAVTYRLCQLNHSEIPQSSMPQWFEWSFDVATESIFQLGGSFQKLKCLFIKTNNGQFILSCIGPNFWNKTQGTLKRYKNLNTFKYDLKT